MNKSDPDYVGFGHPPRAHRFKRGQSGNRKGRPKKPGGGQDVDSCLLQELQGKVTVGGKKLRYWALFASAVVRAASRGDSSAIDYLRAIGAPARLLVAETADDDSPALVEAQYNAVRVEVERRLVGLRTRLRELKVDDRLITAALGARGYSHAETVTRRAAAIEQLQTMGAPSDILQLLRARAERLAGDDWALFPAAS
jgi:hypothetical protein